MVRWWRRRRPAESELETEQQPLEATLELIYEHSRGGPARQLTSADAIDAKAVQVFAAASVVLGLGTFTTSHLNALSAAIYGAAAAAYLYAGAKAWMILRAQDFRVVDAADRWWPSHRLAETSYVREQMLDDLASAAKLNRRLLAEKAQPLNSLLVAIAVEAVLVAAAVIASLA